MLGVLDVLEERKETRDAHSHASPDLSRAFRHVRTGGGGSEWGDEGVVRRGGCSHPDRRHPGQAPVADPKKGHKQRVATRHIVYKQSVTSFPVTTNERASLSVFFLSFMIPILPLPTQSLLSYLPSSNVS